MKLPVLVHSTDLDLNRRFIELLESYEKHNLLFLPMQYFDSPFIAHCPFYAMMFVQFDEQTEVQQEINEFCDNLRNIDPEMQYLVILVPHDKQGVLCAPEKFHRLEFVRVEREHVIMKYDDNFDQILQEAADFSQICLKNRLRSLEQRTNGAEPKELIILWLNQLILKKYQDEAEFEVLLEAVCRNAVELADTHLLNQSVDVSAAEEDDRLFFAQRIESCTMLGVIDVAVGKRYFTILQAREAPILNFEIDGFVVNSEALRHVVECEQFFQEINNERVGLLGFLSYVFCLAINSQVFSAEQMFRMYEYTMRLLTKHEEKHIWQYKMASLLLQERIGFVFQMRLHLHIIVTLKNMHELMENIGFDEMVSKFEELIEGHPDQDIKDHVFVNDVLLREYFKMFTRCPYAYFVRDAELYSLFQTNGRLQAMCQDQFDHILETISMCPGIQLDMMRQILELMSVGFLEHSCEVVFILHKCIKELTVEDAISQGILADNLAIVFDNKLYCPSCDAGCMQRLLVYQFLLAPSEKTLEKMEALQFQEQVTEQNYPLIGTLRETTEISDIEFNDTMKYQRNKLVVYEATDDDANKLSFTLKTQFKFLFAKIEFEHSSLNPTKKQTYCSEVVEGRNDLAYVFNVGIQETDEYYILSKISFSFDKLQWFDALDVRLCKRDVQECLRIIEHKHEDSVLKSCQELFVHTVPMQHHFRAELANTQLFRHCYQNAYINVQENINMDIELQIIVPNEIRGTGEFRIVETKEQITEAPFSCEQERFTLELPVYIQEAVATISILVKSSQKEQKVEIPLFVKKVFNVNVETTLKRISVFYEPLMPLDEEVSVELRTNDVFNAKRERLTELHEYCISSELVRPLEDIEFEFRIVLQDAQFCIATTLINETYIHVSGRQFSAYQLTKPFALTYRISCGDARPRSFELRANEFFVKGPEMIRLRPGEHRDVQVEFLARATGVFSLPWYYCLEDCDNEYSGFEVLDGAGDVHIGDEVVELQCAE